MSNLLMASLDLVSVRDSRKHVLKHQIIVKEKQKLDKTVVYFTAFKKRIHNAPHVLLLGNKQGHS